MKEVLYHFFPRKGRNRTEVLSTLNSIVENGLFLTPEKIDVAWEDRFGKRARKLAIEQHRFCLTAIANRDELVSHSLKFGCIGIGFSVDFIVKLGGFPVFYVPSPDHDSTDEDMLKGISLLYRLAEVQEVLEFISQKKILKTNDIDLDNTIGAIKLLANVCYPTNRRLNAKRIAANYYSQREWRLISGMTSAKAEIIMNDFAHIISSYNNRPIISFVEKIVVNLEGLKKLGVSIDDIEKSLTKHKLHVTIETIG